MNLLTKISIVILVLLVLVGCPVFLKLSITHENYKKLSEERGNKLIIANQDRDAANLAKDYAESLLGASRRNYVSTSAQMQKTINEKNSALDAANTLNKQWHDKFEDIKIDLSALQQNLIQERERRKELLSSLDTLREGLKKKEGELRQTLDALRQEQANVERLVKVSRVLREKIADQEQQIKELDNQLLLIRTGGADDTDTVIPKTPPKVEGTITAVRPDGTASINVGNAHGVRPGLKLIVYRGDKFVGYLRIEEVDPSVSAGIVISQQIDPMRGDKVTSSLKE